MTLVFAFAACAAAGWAMPAAPVAETGRSGPSPSTDFPVRRCINVANALNAPREGEWGYRIERGHFTLIADAGFDTVRLPIAWSLHLDGPGGEIDEDFFERVDEVIEQALEAGLNVIIDVHDFDEIMERPRAERATLATMWRDIAARYADLPESRVFFEILNEPRAALDERMLAPILADALAAIRETNPDRPVIIGGGHWNSIYGLVRMTPPRDANLVATFHYYEPHDFTHQGADFGDDAPPLGRPWGSIVDQARLRASFAEAERWGALHAIPVFLGEFGVFRAAPVEQRALWTRAAREEAEARGMGWCVFDFAASFITYDLARESWVSELIHALGLSRPVEIAPDAAPAPEAFFITDAGTAASSDPTPRSLDIPLRH